jgi:hypothetical protein
MKPNYFIVVDDQTINLRRIQYSSSTGTKSDRHIAFISEIRDNKTLNELINFFRANGITDDGYGITNKWA